jgi:glutamyl-tRNA synthetase
MTSSWSTPGWSTDGLGEVKDRLPDGARQEDWELVRPNLERVGDFNGWMPVLHGEIEPPDLGHDERALVREAAAIAQDIDWSSEPWKQLTGRFKEATGQKGRALFHPLRLAITGGKAARKWPGWSSGSARNGSWRG